MENMSQLKRRIITSMVAILLLVITIFGITYAFFTNSVRGNTSSKSVSTSAGRLELTYADGNGKIEIDRIIPGTIIGSKTFTVKNTGTHYIEDYQVILENVINELIGYEDLTYVLVCSSDRENTTCLGNSGVFPNADSDIAENGIYPNETHSYTLTVTYNETGVNQSDDMNKHVEAKVNITDNEE